MISLSFLCLLCLLLVSFTFGLYSTSSPVQHINSAKEFKQEVLNSDSIAVVEFYAPWCGHCKSFAPEYEKAAKYLKGVVKILAVDATQQESLTQKYGIQGFPTVKIFTPGSSQPEDYNGARTADALVQEAMKATNKLVRTRKEGKDTKKSSNSSSEKKKEKESKKESDVIELTDLNFNALVLESNDYWMLEFYAPWCGHCKNLAPEYKKAARELKNYSKDIKFGMIDATKETALAQKYGIKGYPTLKIFKKTSMKLIDYQGERKAESIVNFIKEDYEQSYTKEIELNQLTSSNSFSTCSSPNSLCVVAFLPHILDSSAKERQNVLSLLKDVFQRHSRLPFSFFWTEANQQQDLEETLQLSSGNYPTLAVISLDKKVFITPKMSFSKKNIESFMDLVSKGGEKLEKLSKIPTLVDVQPWDGKDGNLEVDEIPLSEILGEEL